MPLLLSIFWLVAGGAILIFGGEVFVRGASKIAMILKIPPLIIGLTIVAACTGAPEMAVSLTGALSGSGSSDIALGNVVGSNICNILLVLGLSAIFRPLGISSRLIKREIPFLIVVSMLVWLFAFSSRQSLDAETVYTIPRWGGIIFLILCIAYYIWVVISVKKGDHPEKSKEIDSEFQSAEQNPSGGKKRSPAIEILLSCGMLTVGLLLLIFGANRFVHGAVSLAESFGISELVISLTILAVGTSLPELTVSVLATHSGKCDIAVGNVIGSNTFNILAILGLTAVIMKGGITVSPVAFWIDIPVMILSAVIGSILCITDKKLSRLEGAALLLGFIGYTVSLFFR